MGLNTIRETSSQGLSESQIRALGHKTFTDKELYAHRDSNIQHIGEHTHQTKMVVAYAKILNGSGNSTPPKRIPDIVHDAIAALSNVEKDDKQEIYLNIHVIIKAIKDNNPNGTSAAENAIKAVIDNARLIELDAKRTLAATLKMPESTATQPILTR